MVDVTVDWQKEPISFPDEASQDEIDAALKAHPNYPAKETWGDAIRNAGMFEANAIQQLPFGVGEKLMPKADSPEAIAQEKAGGQSVPDLEAWRKKHPRQAMVSDFLGGTAGYIPAGLAAEAAGGGALAYTGAETLYDLANKAYEKGGLPTAQEAKDSLIQSGLGAGAAKVLKALPIPHHTMELPPAVAESGGSLLGAGMGYLGAKYEGASDPWTAAILGAMLGPKGGHAATLGRTISNWPGANQLLNAMTQQGSKTYSAFNQ